jgi:FKBP-type peptidyl-prolyl cis-trans isomerase 2
MTAVLEPGMLVRHPGMAEWGLGQVQSVVGTRVTVNFEHAGKVVLDSNRVTLVPDFGSLRP